MQFHPPQTNISSLLERFTAGPARFTAYFTVFNSYWLVEVVGASSFPVLCGVSAVAVSLDLTCLQVYLTKQDSDVTL